MIEPIGRSYATPTITSDAALALVNAAMAEARRRNLRISAAIVDAGGAMKAFARMDEAFLLTVELATDKAWTAVSFTLPTHLWNAIVTSDPSVAPLSGRGRLVAVGGGIAIVDGSERIGAIGISGGTAEQDRAIAEAALAGEGFVVPSPPP